VRRKIDAHNLEVAGFPTGDIPRVQPPQPVKDTQMGVFLIPHIGFYPQVDLTGTVVSIYSLTNSMKFTLSLNSNGSSVTSWIFGARFRG
jgi:hypothetical protein